MLSITKVLIIITFIIPIFISSLLSAITKFGAEPVSNQIRNAGNNVINVFGATGKKYIIAVWLLLICVASIFSIMLIYNMAI